MAETKRKGLGLPQTRGSFQMTGKVTGTQKEKFYVEKLTKSDKPWRSVEFGVKFSENETINVRLNGMERDSVWFSKRDENGKTETKEIPWRDRFTFAEKDYSIIGVNVGVKKVKDDKGNDVNDKKRLTDYDACKEIGDNLVDGKTVFVRGNIEYSKYQDSNRTNFIPAQVSLARDIDFEADDFAPNARFTQVIVYMGITKDNGRGRVSAKIVNYDSIEDAEFIIEDTGLCRTFDKTLKPYTSIKVWGDIRVKKNTEEVTVTNCWGQINKMDKQNEPVIRELVIDGADPDSIDTTTYTEAEIDRAIEAAKASKVADNDFGKSTDGWGSVGDSVNDDDNCGW